MDKIYVASYFGAGGSQRGSSFGGTNNATIYGDKEKIFKSLRENIKESFKNFIKNNSPCIGEIRFYCNIIEINIKEDKVKGRTFNINPNELR